MSIPPNTPSSGDSAIPAPKSSGSGVKIAGAGCLALFLLAAVIGVLLVRGVKDRYEHPTKNDFVGIMALAVQAGTDGAHLRRAILAYHAQHRQYPKSLMDLYTDGSIDGKLLHNGLDDSPDPAHVSWRYTPPAEGAPGSTPLLEEAYHVTSGGATQPGKIVITLDGKNRTSTSPSGSMNSR